MRIVPWGSVGRASLDPRPASVTIGVFDGVHVGHQFLLSRLLEERRAGGFAMAVTFAENPKRLTRADYPGDLMTWPERRAKLEEFGVEVLVLVDFSASFSRISGRDFFLALKRSFCFSSLVLGEDFSFGKDSSMSAADLGWLADPVTRLTVCPPLRVDGKAVSSSRIRDAIRKGDLPQASVLLGRPYSLPFSPDLLGEGNTVSLSRNSYSKVLPPNGQYRVRMGGQMGELSIQEEVLTWESPPGERYQELVFV